MILVIGANGMLGHDLMKVLEGEVRGLDLPDIDITSLESVRRILLTLKPEIIINAAAYTDVDGCETNAEQAMEVNGEGVGLLALTAREIGAKLVQISTDYVFDGRKGAPYLEDDPVGPLSAYGRSKLAGERAIIASGLERHFILRTSWLYGPHGRNFVETIIRLAREREELRIVADQIGTPTYTGDLAEAIFGLLKLSDHGIYHFSNSGQCSWYEFAKEIVSQMRGRGASLRIKNLEPIRTEEYPLPARRPAYSVFSKDKYLRATGADIPGWEASLSRYLEERNKEPVTKNP